MEVPRRPTVPAGAPETAALASMGTSPGSPTMSGSRLTALLILGVAASVGCGGSSTGGVVTPSNSGEAAVASPGRDGGSDGDESELPLDWFVRWNGQTSDLEFDLYRGYMEWCMTEAGFSFIWPPEPPLPPDLAALPAFPDRYGVVALAQAERLAYQDPHEVQLGDQELDPQAGLPSDPAEREAFHLA